MERNLALPVVFVSAVVAVLAVQAYSHVYVASYPHAVNYVEGFVLDDAIRLGRLDNIYRDPSVPPYTLSVYPPLYPLITGWILSATGTALWPARAVSLIAFALLCGLVGGSVARSSGLGVGIAAGVTLAASAAFHPWAAMAKPDLLALVLSFAGLYVLELGDRRLPLSWGRTLAVALLLAGGLWAKQSFIAAPAAAFVWLWFRSRVDALRVAVLVTGLVALPAGLLQLASGGWFAHHVVIANANPWAFHRVGQFWLAFAETHFILLLLAAIVAVDAVRRRQLDLQALYLLAAVSVSLSVGKIGSDRNYLLEPLTALVWWTGCSPDWRTWLERRRWLAWAVMGAMVFQWALSVPGSLRDTRLAAASRTDVAKVSEWVATVPGMLISDEAGLLVLNGKAVVLQPFVMAQMARAGLWDDEPLVADLRARRFDVIILGMDPPGVVTTRYTRRALEAIQRHYTEVGSFVSMGQRYSVRVPTDALPPAERP